MHGSTAQLQVHRAQAGLPMGRSPTRVIPLHAERWGCLVATGLPAGSLLGGFQNGGTEAAGFPGLQERRALHRHSIPAVHGQLQAAHLRPAAQPGPAQQNSNGQQHVSPHGRVLQKPAVINNPALPVHAHRCRLPCKGEPSQHGCAACRPLDQAHALQGSRRKLVADYKPKWGHFTWHVFARPAWELGSWHLPASLQMCGSAECVAAAARYLEPAPAADGY